MDVDYEDCSGYTGTDARIITIIAGLSKSIRQPVLQSFLETPLSLQDSGSELWSTETP